MAYAVPRWAELNCKPRAPATRYASSATTVALPSLTIVLNERAIKRNGTPNGAIISATAETIELA